MRFSTIALSLLALSGVALAATDDEIMDTRYGNTTLVHETIGTSHIYYNKDHTFTGGNWILNVSGKWDISDTKDGGKQICLHWDSTPLGHPNPECDKVEHHNIGDKWELNGRKFELVKGIVK
jgi:hypothetical protein